MDDSLDTLIQEELEKWREEGVADPAAILTCNSFFESIKLLAIKNILVEKGIINQDEIESEFKAMMLENLREARQGYKETKMKKIIEGMFNGPVT